MRLRKSNERENSRNITELGTTKKDKRMKLIMILWILLILAVLYFLINDFKKKIMNKEKE